MKCTNCGIDHEANFCPNCGEPLQVDVNRVQTPTQPPLKRKVPKGCIIAVAIPVGLFVLLIIIGVVMAIVDIAKNGLPESSSSIAASPAVILNISSSSQAPSPSSFVPPAIASSSNLQAPLSSSSPLSRVVSNALLDSVVQTRPVMNGTGDTQIGEYQYIEINKEQVKNVTPEMYQDFLDARLKEASDAGMNWFLIKFEDNTCIFYVSCIAEIAEYSQVAQYDMKGDTIREMAGIKDVVLYDIISSR